MSYDFPVIKDHSFYGLLHEFDIKQKKSGDNHEAVNEAKCVAEIYMKLMDLS